MWYLDESVWAHPLPLHEALSVHGVVNVCIQICRLAWGREKKNLLFRQSHLQCRDVYRKQECRVLCITENFSPVYTCFSRKIWL